MIRVVTFIFSRLLVLQSWLKSDCRFYFLKSGPVPVR